MSFRWCCDDGGVDGEAAAVAGPVLDRECPIWRGTFGGLGSVRVLADGGLEIEVDESDQPDADEIGRRHDALRWGWGEPLGWARRGCEVTVGSALVGPRGGPALLLRGNPHDVPVVVCGLAQRGWRVVADRFVPLRWSDDAAEVQSTATPVLVARRRARAMGLDWVDVRHDSDSAIVEVPRADCSAAFGGVVDVVGRRVGAPNFERLEGHERFEMASRLAVTGALLPDGGGLEPSARMARDLRVAALPIARAHLEAEAPNDACEAIESWWLAVWPAETS